MLERIPKRKSPQPFSVDVFPDHLGLGTLASVPVPNGTGGLVAEYLQEEEIVYHVTLTPDECVIIEYLDGQEVARTIAKELEKGFVQHMLCLKPYRSHRLERLHDRITRGRNIYLKFADQPELVFFPAGYGFTIRQPVVEGNKAKWNLLKKQLSASTSSLPVSSLCEHKGVVLRLLESSEVDVQQVIVGELVATLTQLADAADFLWASGIVPSEKEHRLEIADSSITLPGRMLINLGDRSRGFLTFSVCVYKENGDIPEGVAGQFAKASERFLEGLNQQV